MNDPLWINESGGAPEYNASELRRNFATLLHLAGETDRFGAREGVRPGGADAASLSGTTINVQNHNAVIYPGFNTLAGPYIIQIPATTHELDAADGTNPREDILVDRVYDDDQDSTGRREAVSEYIPGVPNPSPSPPAVPQGAILLATINVPASGTGSPSMTYQPQFTSAVGGIIPVRDSSEYPSVGRYPGLTLWDDSDNALYVYSETPGISWYKIADADYIEDTGNQTVSVTMETGWALNYAVYRRIGRWVDLRVSAERTGSALSAGSGGNVADSSILFVGDGSIIPANNRIIIPMRATTTGGDLEFRTSGEIRLTDMHSNSQIQTGHIVYGNAAYIQDL